MTGRNELCPCGSGKKYKKCHLGINDGGVSRIQMSEKMEFNTGTKLGKPGTYGEVILVGRYKNDRRTDMESLTDRSMRSFKLYGFFSKGELERTKTHFNLDPDPENGSSFLMMKEDVSLSN